MSDDERDTTDAGEADALMEQYTASLRRITALPELPMRRAALGEIIGALDDDEAVWWIDQLVRGALWGRSPETDAMLACSDWLIRLRFQDDDYDRIQALFTAAAAAERESVLMLLRDPPPHRTLRKGARLPEVRLPLDRDVSVGERRSLSRGQDRQLLDRLLLDNNPIVMDQLLENSSLVVADAVTVAARRPTLPELVLAVALKPRWLKEIRVREAVVQNPFAATGLALKLLPTLHVQSLRRIRGAGDLHPTLHEAADTLIRLREERTAPWRV